MNGIFLAGDGASAGFTLADLLENGNMVLTWFIKSFGVIFQYFMENPALLIWFFVSLAGVAFVFFRKLF